MRGILFLLIFPVFILACTTPVEDLEIPQEKLVEILADVHISEGAILGIRPLNKDSFRNMYYNQIYDIHEVSGAAFEHDIDVLKRNPKMMEQVYEKVLERLGEMEKELSDKNPKKEK